MTSPLLPSQSSDFPAWYGEVVRRAELAENSPVRGAMVIKPYGYLGQGFARTYLAQGFARTYGVR